MEILNALFWILVVLIILILAYRNLNSVANPSVSPDKRFFDVEKNQQEFMSRLGNSFKQELHKKGIKGELGILDFTNKKKKK